jgi:integrase/recombinase XerD
MRFKSLIPKQIALQKAGQIVAYLRPEEVYQLAEASKEIVERDLTGQKKERNYLLILTLFQTGLRISETLSLTPNTIRLFEGKPALEILGKGKKKRQVALPERLAEKLQAFAYKYKLSGEDRFFNINRFRAWQIINKAAEKAGFNKRVYPHLLRHSDAIERLRQTGNPKALQHHLGHSNISRLSLRNKLKC